MLPPYRRRRAAHDDTIDTSARPRPATEDTRMSVIGFSDFDHQRDGSEALCAGIVARAQGRPLPARAELWADAHMFSALAHARLMACGRDRGVRADSHGDVLHLALTTSDFPFWLGTTAKALVLDHYQNATPAYRRLLARRDFANFHHTSVSPAGDFPVPLEVAEDGEAKAAPIVERGELGQLSTYRRRVYLSRQTLVDDDGGAFADLARAAALRTVDLEEQLFFSALTSGTSANGPTLRDGGQFFSTTRGNLASSGAAISAATISTARAAVMSAVSPTGVKSIATPKFLLCPPALLTLAETELAKVNPGSDPTMRIVPIGTPHLSGTAWYLFADPKQRPAFVYSYLEGSPGPTVVSRPHWESEGIEIALTLDFGITAGEPGAAFRNPGA